MSADIEFLDGIKSNSKAVFHDAINRSELDNPAIAIWMDKDNEIHWSCCTTNQQCLWMLEKMKGNVL